METYFFENKKQKQNTHTNDSISSDVHMKKGRDLR